LDPDPYPDADRHSFSKPWIQSQNIDCKEYLNIILLSHFSHKDLIIREFRLSVQTRSVQNELHVYRYTKVGSMLMSSAHSGLRNN